MKNKWFIKYGLEFQWIYQKLIHSFLRDGQSENADKKYKFQTQIELSSVNNWWRIFITINSMDWVLVFN